MLLLFSIIKVQGTSRKPLGGSSASDIRWHLSTAVALSPACLSVLRYSSIRQLPEHTPHSVLFWRQLSFQKRRGVFSTVSHSFSILHMAEAHTVLLKECADALGMMPSVLWLPPG